MLGDSAAPDNAQLACAHQPLQETKIPIGSRIRIASDVPDLGSASTIPDFWGWCNRQRESLRQFRMRLGEPEPASVANDEFRIIPEIVRQCRHHLLGFGANAIPERFAFPGLPYNQTPTGLQYFGSAIDSFIAWASGYRRPGHSVMNLIGEVEEFLTWTMTWAKQQTDTSGPVQTRQHGQTNDQLVSQYLGTHPSPRIDEVIQATGLSEQRIRQTQAWKDHEESALQKYLLDHPDAGTRDVQRNFCFSPAKTAGMNAWKAHMARKKAAKPPRKIKEKQLTDGMVRNRPNDDSADPSEVVDRREQIFRVVLENADPETKAELQRLPETDRASLVEHILRVMDCNDLSARDSTQALQIMMEVAKSWLDEKEQHRREEARSERQR
jgi:hypothetical protein